MLRTDGPAALPWWLRPAARRGWRAALGLALLAVAWLVVLLMADRRKSE